MSKMIESAEFKQSHHRVKDVCDYFSISKQGYYKSQKVKMKEAFDEEIIIEMIMEVRRKLPKTGGKKLYRMLKKDLILQDIELGRDKFFDLLRENGLLIEKQRQYVKTTNSRHHYYIYENLIKGLDINRKNQVLVSDITYIRTNEGFCYLSLITDLYSRKILGYDVNISLGIDGTLKALKNALRGIKNTEGMIHHSDRGVQYCSYPYTDILKSNNINISMGEAGNPYDNAVAERVNGILKDEFGLNAIFDNIKHAEKAVREAVKYYNELRLHTSIGYKTPAEKYAA
jgi:transposase InsO family protein